MNYILIWVTLLLFAGCASKWKVQGGPKSCQKMCDDWGLEFSAMVGVGNQDRSGDGATACVCQPRTNKTSVMNGAGSSTASLAGPIVAAQAAAAAEAARHNQKFQSNQIQGHRYR